MTVVRDKRPPASSAKRHWQLRTYEPIEDNGPPGIVVGLELVGTLDGKRLPALVEVDLRRIGLNDWRRTRVTLTTADGHELELSDELLRALPATDRIRRSMLGKGEVALGARLAALLAGGDPKELRQRRYLRSLATGGLTGDVLAKRRSEYEELCQTMSGAAAITVMAELHCVTGSAVRNWRSKWRTDNGDERDP